MSEKVLGFYKKDALYDNGQALVKGWAIDEGMLVPVVLKEKYDRLKKELVGLGYLKRGIWISDQYWKELKELKDLGAVSVSALEEWCKENESKMGWVDPWDLLSWAKKEAEK